MLTAGVAGFWVWFEGARPGISGSFEGERDLSLLAVELPLMALGLPLPVLVCWAGTRCALRPRGSAPSANFPAFLRTLLPPLIALAVLVLSLWGCREWLAVRVADFVNPGI